MKHITIIEYGSFLGIKNERLIIKESGKEIYDVPLSRIKTISIAKNGVSLSSNLVLACSVRGIKIFFLDFRGTAVACISSTADHAVCKIREKQFSFLNSNKSLDLASITINSKVRNQRALLKYFGKSKSEEKNIILNDASEKLKNIAETSLLIDNNKNHKEKLLGFEGYASKIYWEALVKTELLPETFNARQGRHSPEITNQALNFGYAILSSYVWHCLLNAGLEIYAGYLHSFRPGKPSLVLDVMEEYRSWAVDRAIIKNRDKLTLKQDLDTTLKKIIISDIHNFFTSYRLYYKKKIKTENILQRQIYKMCAYLLGEKKYKPYIFAW